jgi:ribosomal protein S18 acetylase RimI-like enzyme
MAMAALAPTGIKFDRWLSELSGRPTWSVDPAAASGAEAIDQAGPGPLFLYARVPADDVKTLNSFEDAGFRVVDLSVTLEAPAGPLRLGAPRDVRAANPSDEIAVRAIAATAFTSSRLHLDPGVPRTVADRSRGEWAGNFFHGRRGDAMFVADHEGAVAGFVLAFAPIGAAPVVIDLIAIRPDARRLGLGMKCIQHLAAYFGSAQRVRVGTQAANVGSLRFYARLGFEPIATHYVLHFHRD